MMRLNSILFSVLIAAGLSSCMKSSFEQSYTDICTFEYRDTSQYFVNGLFNKSDFGTGNSNALTLCGKRHEESGEFRGGMMVGIRRDSTYREGYIPKNLWVVADSVGGAALSKGYGIFYDSQVAMPDHEVVFNLRTIGTCSLNGLCVANTNYTVNAAKYGFSDCPKFQEGDYLKFTVNAIQGEAKTGSASIDLVKYDKSGLTVQIGWKAMEIKNALPFDYLDFELQTNRADLPLYCCIDNMVASVSVKQ